MANVLKMKLAEPDEVESNRMRPGWRVLESYGTVSSDPKTIVDSDKAVTKNKFSTQSKQSLSSNYEKRDFKVSEITSNYGSDYQLFSANRKASPTPKEKKNFLKNAERLLEISEDTDSKVKAATDVRVNKKEATTKTFQSHTSVNQQMLGKGEEKPRKAITFSSSEDQIIKLHESSNPWRPLHKCETLLDEKDRIKRTVLGVLNKLTPQKFVTLLSQLKGLNIDTEEKLALVIDLIFEKAVNEPNFSVPYANLCKHLAMIKVPVSGMSGTQVNFRKLLLTKCQKEFEQDRSDELKNEEKMKTLEAADRNKKKELQLEYEEEEKKIRYRQLGNIRFIGELFKLGMIIEPIMHACIRKLLIQGDEKSLECLCLLLKTIGKELDDTKMDLYFSRMQLIVNKRLTNSRIRFLLQDVIDLKKNSWVPRRDATNLQTIHQIYNARIWTHTGRKKNCWSSISRSSKERYNMANVLKMKLAEPDEVESNRIWPGWRVLESYRTVSSDAKTIVDSDKTVTKNKFSTQSKQSLSSNYEKRDFKISERTSNYGSDYRLLSANRKASPTSKEKKNFLKNAEGLLEISEGTDSKVKAATDVRMNKKETTTKKSDFNGLECHDDMKMKTQPLVDEFPHNKDFEEAVKRVIELASPNTVHMLINAAINQVLEQSSQARYSLGQLLSSLLKKKIITFQQYKNGFAGVLEIKDNYALDIPLIWDYMGEILEPLIEDIETPFELLKEVLQPCIPSEKAGMLVFSILHSAAKRKGAVRVGKIWRDSDVQWSDITGSDGNEFFQKHVQ